MFARQDIGSVLDPCAPAAASVGVLAGLVAGNTPVWQPWQHLAGVFYLAGPRSDGRLVAAGGSRLYLVSPDGLITPLVADPVATRGPAGGAEAYIDVSPGLHVTGSGCAFARDDVFAIRPSAPLGITRVDATGQASNFVDIAGVDTLNGIVFDRVGRFDHRLLVTGPHHGHTTVLAIDCKAPSSQSPTAHRPSKVVWPWRPAPLAGTAPSGLSCCCES
jgi:hypothetical protein